MADAKTAEAGKPEVPKLMRSFSKGYQKTKEALKKGFATTPRGSRSFSGRMASTEIPDMENTAPPGGPQVPIMKEGTGTGPNAATDVAVKATVKVSTDRAAPVEIKLEPVANSKPPLAQLQEPVAPDTPTSAPPSVPAPAAPKTEKAPAPARVPAPAPAPEAPKTEEPAQASRVDKVQAPLQQAPAEEEAVPDEAEEMPVKEEATLPGSKPPEVRVVVNGMQTDAAKPEAESEKPEPINLHVEPVKKSSGGKAKKVVLGLFALAAVSAVSLVVRGKIER